MFLVEKINVPDVQQEYGLVDDYYGKITEKNNDYYFEMYFVIVNNSTLPIGSYKLSIVNPKSETMKVDLIDTDLLPKYLKGNFNTRMSKVYRANFVLAGSAFSGTEEHYTLTLGISLQDSCLNALTSDQIINAKAYMKN